MKPPISGHLRIAVVNDYEIVVAGIAAMLADHRDRVEVVELDNSLPVLTTPDIILLDTFGHLTRGGADLTDLLRPDGPQVVIYTWVADPASIEAALAQGVAGFVSKALTAAELVDALEAIHAGTVATDSCYGPVGGPTRQDDRTSRDPTLDPGPGQWPGRDHDLSAREAEMIALIAKGLTNQEIADTLFLSINSVKTYIRTAYRKIGVRRRSQAVGWALEHGFATEPARSFPHL